MKRKINSQNMIFLAIVTLFWVCPVCVHTISDNLSDRSRHSRKCCRERGGRWSDLVLPGSPFEGRKKKRFREQPDSAGTVSGVPGQTDHCVFP